VYVTQRLLHCSTLCWRSSMKSSRQLTQRRCSLPDPTLPLLASICEHRCNGVLPPNVSPMSSASYSTDKRDCCLSFAFLSRFDLDWTVASLKMYFITSTLPAQYAYTWQHQSCNIICKSKVPVVPYSIMSIGLRADPGLTLLQSACKWVSQKPGGRLPLLSTRPAVTFPAKEITPHGRYQIILLGDWGTQVWVACSRPLRNGA